ncbi:purple acid phosphatase 17-like isoform X2 [Abrus precatorius]|uniref:Purple acid phosphatase n=1 Tax=Abrus precatorius TaxID=3816 RepID=A0A8B8K7Z9_ABRPR|nr:purple acid phosphatase 17-like isoform X2 [Abrus precatorius]
MAIHSFLFTISIVLCILHASAELQRFSHPSKHDGSLSFLVLGDWGRRGAYNQSEVAFQMGKVGEKLDIDFVVSTGDNFYDNGLTSDRDNAFEESFTKIYTAKSLQKQWYSVLGNHDYRELVEIFFVDTTPFVEEYFTEPQEYDYDWRGISPQKSYITNLLKDIELALRESTAKWKIVVGHHAIRSVGHHGDTQELIMQLLPILQANNIDFYMNGHDHCLEHISDTQSPIQFLTSGAGSKAWRGDTKQMNRKGLNFFYDGQGFMSVKLTQTDATIEFYDVFGKVLHRLTSSKLMHSSI